MQSSNDLKIILTGLSLATTHARHLSTIFRTKSIKRVTNVCKIAHLGAGF